MEFFKPFSGSYRDTDVQFLLAQVAVEETPVDIKEALIQSGAKHYSEMISREDEPSRFHLAIYQKSLEANGARLASEVVALAKGLAKEIHDTPIVLVSLVRAGVPLGVMLHHALQGLGVQTHHYGVSIIRDRGLDDVAMNHIEAVHGTAGIVFVDGWTGKGAITSELEKSLINRPGYSGKPRLVVLADLCGRAWMSASKADWLIPFGIMGAPISGLISRSIWSDTGAHGCVQCDYLASFDHSVTLVDYVKTLVQVLDWNVVPAAIAEPEVQSALRARCESVVSMIADRYQIASMNRIKPGIAEATRAVLRRVPEQVIVRSRQDPDVALLIHLSEEKDIAVVEGGDEIAPYRAITIIKKVS